MTRHPRATPANVPRSRSRWTRRQRAENCRRVQEHEQACEAMYDDDDEHDDFYSRDERERCGGEGLIEYAEGGPEVWGEDCPSEVNHLVTCPDCGGNG